MTINGSTFFIHLIQFQAVFEGFKLDEILLTFIFALLILLGIQTKIKKTTYLYRFLLLKNGYTVCFRL